MKHLREIANNEPLRKRLAKLMALECFRNTQLENLHIGIFPGSKTDDYSDVKVVSPYGEIAWNKLSRLSDEEMKPLMIEVVNNCYMLLTVLFDSDSCQALIEELKRDPEPKWYDPTLQSTNTRLLALTWRGWEHQ
jgi:hypothetical protein